MSQPASRPMDRVWTVAKRDLRGFFDHAVAYILAVAFLGLSFFLTFRNLYAVGLADLRSFFDLLPWLLAVFVPAVTMRSLAEERSRGTLEWLVTQPLTEAELVAGKFLASWLFVLATLAGTLPMAVGVVVLAGAPVGPVVAQYLGSALLSAELAALGLFASALTRNQITSFIVAAILSVALVLAGASFTLMTLPGPVAVVVRQLSVVPHFLSVSLGVVDLRDVLYFLSMTALFCGLAWFWVVRERLSPRRGAYLRLRTGVTAAVLAIVVLNLLGQRIHGRIDLTADRLYTLSDGTRDVLRGLDDLVTVKLFVSDALPPEIQGTLRDLRDLLADYRRVAGDNLRVIELHPDEDEEAASEATSLGIREIQFNVMRADQFEVRNGWLGVSVQYADAREAFPYIARTDDMEYRLTAALAAMTSERRPRVAFLTGFGGRGAAMLQPLSQVLGDRYQVTSVDVSVDPAPPELSPDSIDIVAVVGNTEPWTAQAAATLDAYLDAGGGALLLLENNRLSDQAPITEPFASGLQDLIGRRGVRLADQMVYDVRSNETVSLGRQSIFNLVAPYPLWPLAVPATRHSITKDLERLGLAWAAPLDVTDPETVTPLWTTTPYGGRRNVMGGIDPQTAVDTETLDPSTLGTQTLAAAVLPEEGEGGRLVVVGDADFIQGQFIQNNPQNLSFVANAVDWLAQDESLIEIRSKDRTPPPLVFGSDVMKSSLKWGNMAGVPLLFVLVGLMRIAGRRRKAEELWTRVEGFGQGGHDEHDGQHGEASHE
ncbi:MAG TPA: Gldg family protein [Longimicrobiales bacterium]